MTMIKKQKQTHQEQSFLPGKPQGTLEIPGMYTRRSKKAQREIPGRQVVESASTQNSSGFH